MNNLTQFNVINLIILAGLVFFAAGMSIVLMSIYKSKKPSAEIVEDFELYEDIEENTEEEFENDDIVEETPEDLVDEIEEPSGVSDEELVEQAAIEPAEEEIEESIEDPAPEIDDSPKARITLAGTNNPDFIIYEFKESATLGRRNTNDIIISDSAVSGNHCKFTFEDGAVYLTDLESTNGTLINGETVINTEIKSGDLIMLGQHQYRITVTY